MVVADIEFEFALSKTIEATKEQEAVSAHVPTGE